LSDRDRVHIRKADTGLLEGGDDDRVHQLEVMPGCHLRNDSAVALVECSLRGDDARENSLLVDHRRAGVVAGGLDRQQRGHATEAPSATSNHMINASSPLSW